MNPQPPPTTSLLPAPLVDNLQQGMSAVQNATATVTDKIGETTSAIATNVSNATESIGANLKEFSSPAQITNASESFLNSNGIIAKFVFLILVVIVFLFLMNLGITLVGYFLKPPRNPIVVNGMIPGTNFLDISRDPKTQGSIDIKHSNNQNGGMEFTWSVWLNLQKNTNTTTQYSHIFSVGNNTFDPKTGIATVENGPGLYLVNTDASGNPMQNANLHVIMDTMTDGISSSESVEIENLPYDKWFNVVLRMKNNFLDVYVNGVITSRIRFINVPKQNYSNVLVCANGGFIGTLSLLQYYDYALNVFEIGSLLYWGPKMSPPVSKGGSKDSGNYSYLSSQWYSTQLN